MSEHVLRVLVADDEPLVRERVRDLIRAHPDLEQVGEARTGLEALDLIAKLVPDVLLLDVQMPELDGFGVLAALEVDHTPAVILVTAFDHYALRAFDVGAIDFLHKPLTQQRFDVAITRARVRVEQADAVAWRRLVRDAGAAELSRGPRVRFVVRRGNTHHVVPIAAVDWIDVADNYLRLHAGTRIHFWRGTMKDVEAELDRSQFLRVHRSAIIAINRIQSVRRLTESGTFAITLTSGVEVRSSRQYADRLRPWIRR